LPAAREADAPGRTQDPGSGGPERSPYWRVRRVVLGYVVFASLWILLSDRLVNLMFQDPALVLLANSMKGLAFVLITSSLLLVTLNRAVRKLMARTAELRASESRLQLAAASAGLGIWDRHPQAGTEIWNARMWELYGLEPQPVPPSYATWRDSILHPDDRDATEAAIRAALAGEGPYDLEFRAILPDGSVRHIKSDALVLRGPGGEVLRLIGINRDRTAKVEAEAEQRRLQADRLHAEKLDSIGSLAGGVAHDMNNVLAAILGVASALRQQAGHEDGPRGDSLDTIIRACLRGRDVVRSLLTFARKDLEAFGPLDLNAVAAEMVQLLRHTTLSRIEIRTAFQEPLSLVEGDAGALNHALLNLCVNAVDAMPDGGALELRTRQVPGGLVEIRIQDTGRGMAPELVRRAAEPFFTTKAAGKGTGLGLAMVYSAVKAHQGRLELHSEVGLGTRVSLLFPPCAPAAAGAGAEPRAAQAPPRGRKILLVDDDEMIQWSMKALLDVLGHVTTVAGSGEEALERLAAGYRPDVVVLDMNMPGLGGAATLPLLRAHCPGVPVLLATGRADQAALDLVAGHANVRLLPKPFTMDEFDQSLAALAGA